jgi:(p)ppGpp synthase/HD superfamily hydrolase
MRTKTQRHLDSYITHPVAVAGLVAQHGGDEDLQIAALLHDVLEDGRAHYAARIGEQFGPRVLAIVEACTDGTPMSRVARHPGPSPNAATWRT